MFYLTNGPFPLEVINIIPTDLQSTAHNIFFFWYPWVIDPFCPQQTISSSSLLISPGELPHRTGGCSYSSSLNSPTEP